jgi:hypothetical protein
MGVDKWGLVPSTDKHLSRFPHIQVCFGSQPASYLMGTGISFLRVKWLQSYADHSPLPIGKIMNMYSFTFML